MKISFGYQTEQEEALLLEEEILHLNDLVLYNDDVNTFDFVIETLVELCDHDPLQAEQCAHLVHFTGRCGVKRGTAQELQPVCLAMLDRGLSAKIE